MQQKPLGEFLYFKYFFMAAYSATGYAKFSIVELDRSIKGYPIKIKENYESYFA